MLCVRDGVVVVHPARLLNLARVMRRMVEEVHRAALTSEGQDAKGAELCAFLSSVEFRQAFDALAVRSDSSRACSARSERGTSVTGRGDRRSTRTWAERPLPSTPSPNHHREDGRRQTSREVRDMALLERLFHGKPKQEISPGDERLDVVGEWYHQDALWRIVGGHRHKEVQHETQAVLMPDSADSEYPEAIRVVVDGKVVGSLSREPCRSTGLDCFGSW